MEDVPNSDGPGKFRGLIGVACCLLAGMDDPDRLPVVTVDRVEQNHVVSARGVVSLNQHVAWVYYPGELQPHVAFWWTGPDPLVWVERDGYSQAVVWRDGQAIRLRCRAHSETWTLTDPELEDRQLYDQNRRRGWALLTRELEQTFLPELGILREQLRKEERVRRRKALLHD